MKRFLGFTLSELMIAITVLGILCATVLPAVLGNNPNQNKMMIKKAYYTASEIVSELINDPGLYPDKTSYCNVSITDENCYIGFDDTSEVTYRGKTQINDKCKFKSDTKFAGLFISQLNYDDDIITGALKEGVSVITTDGIKWTIASREFATAAENGEINGKWSKGDADSYEVILVDVNGDKKPNCYEGSNVDSCKNRTSNFDQFRIRVYADGKTEIDPADVWAAESIQVSSSLSED